VAIVTDTRLETSLPQVHLDDIPAVADLVLKVATPLKEVLARASETT
jgi:molybdopterin-guanine dinucleotide biosynthesis protein B